MWDKLSMKEKAAFIRTAVKNGVYNLDDIRSRYNKFAENAVIEETVDNVNKSKADFVNRLKDADRQYIKDWEHPGYIATHKLSVGTDSKGNNYIYPEVQNIDGKLVDFTRPPYLPYAGMISAEEREDTVRVPSIEQGVRFTENYKKYYPKGKTFAKGGHIYDGLTEDNRLFQKGGNLKGGKRAGDKVNTTQCATWSNGLLRDNGYLISGNAWGLNHADMLFNGFDGLEKPEVYNRAEVENYNHNAAGNVYANFKSGTLNKNKPYVVNMYYNGSPAQEEAYKNGKGVTGTHTGILTHDGKEWKVTHNIHGTIHEEPFFSLQRGDNNYGVTAIYEPREDNLVNRIKGFLGFKYGGYLTM